MIWDWTSRWILIGLICLTLGKIAYYAVEWTVRPSISAKPLSLRVKGVAPMRHEARNISAEELKTDRLR